MLEYRVKLYDYTVRYDQNFLMPAKISRVAVALGGGGAKGVVHLGVLRAVDILGLSIESLVGTSIGAIWCSLYANALVMNGDGELGGQSKAIKTVEDIAYQLRFSEYRDLDFIQGLARGFVKGERFERWLGNLLWNRGTARLLTFRDLDAAAKKRVGGLGLTITTTDASTGASVLCNVEQTPDMPVARAVRASMSIQGLFREVAVEVPGLTGGTRQIRCWDGGTTGNCRFDIAAKLTTHPVIASSLTYRNEPVTVDKGLLRLPWRLSRIRDHSINILLSTIEQLLLENAVDKNRIVLVRPPLSDISTFDFNLSNLKKAEAIATAFEWSKAEIAARLAERQFEVADA